MLPLNILHAHSPRQVATQTAALAWPPISSLPVLVQTPQVEVVSGLPNVSNAQASALVTRLMRAYRYDLRRQGWSAPLYPVYPFTAAVLSKQRIFQQWPGAAAYTPGPGLIAIGPQHLIEGDSDGVLAHELSHMLHGGTAPTQLKLPRPIEEGNAKKVQHDYLQSLGLADPALPRAAAFLATVTPEYARYVLEQCWANLQGASQVGKEEDTGELFHEFLRTRLLPNEGRAGADPVLLFGKIVRDLPANLTVAHAGYRTQFNDEFRAQFGVSFQEAENQFLAYLAKTQGDATQRLAGTIWDGP